jgi:glycosyltransferase 2 family protein
MRWKILLHPLRPDTSVRSRFAAVNIGFMANNLLPARVGEFARAYSLSRLERVTASGSFGSLVVERFLDGVALTTLLFVALLSPGFPQDATVGGQPLGAAVRVIVLMLGILLAILVVLLLRPRVFVGTAGRLAVMILPADYARRTVDALEALLEGLEVLRSPKLLAAALAWSLFFWSWNAISFWLGFLAFGIEQGYTTALFVQAVIALFVAIPSSPGFFGTFHAGAVVGLSEVFGVDRGQTLSFAFGYHLGGFIPVTVIGLYYAWRLGFSLEEVERSEDEIEKAVESEHPEAVEILEPEGERR